MIEGTTNSAENAVNASNAYRAISGAINDADNASMIAVTSAEEAGKQADGLADRARESKQKSEELKTQAESTKTTVTNGNVMINNGLNDLKLFVSFRYKVNISL